MPVRFLLDEHLRGRLLEAIERYNARSAYPLDAVEVGGPLAPSRGTSDPDLIRWAERTHHVILTRDKQTMSEHLAAHLRTGGHCPGVMVLRQRLSYQEVIDLMVLITYASDSDEWRDLVRYIP